MPKANGSNHAPQIEPNRRPVNPAERGQSRRFKADSCSYDGIENQVIRDTVVAVTSAGAALLLGRTSDGGAFTIQVYDGNDSIREYPHTSEEATDVLRWITAIYTSD